MRTRMRSVVVFLFGVMVMSLLAACSGGGDDTPAETKVGKFTGVSNVQYEGSHTGSTGIGEKQGEYTYTVGSNVKFFIGNITLGEATAKLVVTPLDLVPNGTETTPGVLNIVRLLMSVGTVDGNNINISQATRIAAKGVPATTVSTLDEAGLAALVQAVNPDATLATTEQASDLLAAWLGKVSEGFAGTYKGPVFDDKGADLGWTIELTVDAAGVLQDGSRVIIPGGDDDTLSGQITGSNFVADAVGGCHFEGTIDGNGKITGHWVAPVGGQTKVPGGTFTVNKIS